MRKRRALFTFFLLITLIGIYFVNELKVSPAITYFPIDYGTSFQSAKTSLNLLPDHRKDYYNLSWTDESISNTTMYLRQDVSLLFANGELKGMRSKWRENTNTIRYTEKLKGGNPALWHAISFHYGEIHTGNTIHSIQKMTHDKLAVFQENTVYQSDKVNKTTKQIENVKQKTKKILLAHWQDLLTYFHIDVNQYHSIPLTDLYQYQNQSLPNVDKETSDRIIGQLWEGLYKNYIIPNIKSKIDLESYIPLILYKKDGDHLLVLYEVNGHREKLIQKISE